MLIVWVEFSKSPKEKTGSFMEVQAIFIPATLSPSDGNPSEEHHRWRWRSTVASRNLQSSGRWVAGGRNRKGWQMGALVGPRQDPP